MIKISLDVEDYCNDCPYFSTETSHATNGEGTHLIYVSCEHKVSCSRLFNYLDSKIKEKGEGSMKTRAMLELIVDFVMVCGTGGVWLILILIRYLRRS